MANKHQNPAPSSTKQGQFYEQQAEQYLQQQGLIPITRNFHCRAGEIDLIMRHGDYVVFVEVKFRKNAQYGGAIYAVSAAKQKKLIRSAQYYLQQYHNSSPACRFDVVAIEGHRQHISWLQNAFDSNE